MKEKGAKEEVKEKEKEKKERKKERDKKGERRGLGSLLKDVVSRMMSFLAVVVAFVCDFGMAAECPVSGNCCSTSPAVASLPGGREETAWACVGKGRR